MRMPEWFRSAIGYEVYPQSFLDTNGDGIGDLPGVIRKLDYIRALGCNVVWLNPCFDSPMWDGGYDVRNYREVDKRYGTNDDLIRLFSEAHRRGMYVLLDLVPGHTSREHPWFQQSQKPGRNEYSDRYIWTGSVWDKPREYNWICGSTERDGCAMVNFFEMQPALNYGFNRMTHSWQMDWRDPRCAKTLDAIMDVMRFWLSRGCDGFRVDMADSLVKNDDEKDATSALWRRVQEMLANEFPEAVLVAEWNWPEYSLCKARFQGDFYLNWGSEQGGGYRTLMRDGESTYFRKEARGDLNRFLNEYTHRYLTSREDGYICMITGNHDTDRASKQLSPDELKMAYSLLFTLPGVPFIYAGDEIGMRYLPLDSREGGYGRTGSRTPMQWDSTAQYGFSTNPDTFLPQDRLAGAPTVAAQEGDGESMLEYVRTLLKLRADLPELGADAPFETVWMGQRGYPFVYRRGNVMLALNAAGVENTIPFDVDKPLFVHGGVRRGEGTSLLLPQSFVIWRAEGADK